MDKQKLNLFLDRLLEKTKEGKLEWETTVNKSTFLVGLQDTAISVAKVSDDQYIFDFRNNMGDIVDLVIISKKDFPVEEFSENEYGKAKQIFDLARQQSLKGEQTFERILEQLAA